VCWISSGRLISLHSLSSPPPGPLGSEHHCQNGGGGSWNITLPVIDFQVKREKIKINVKNRRPNNTWCISQLFGSIILSVYLINNLFVWFFNPNASLFAINQDTFILSLFYMRHMVYGYCDTSHCLLILSHR